MTLMAAGSFVAALSALLLAGVRTQIAGAIALSWWSAANLVFAVGIGVLAVGLSSNAPLTIAAGGALTSFSPALVWAGVRKFGGRRAPFPLVFGGVAVSFVVGLLPFGDVQQAGTIAGFACWIVYLLAAVQELWRGRGERLPARWGLSVLFVLHASVFLGGIVDMLSGQFQQTGIPPLDSWFGIIHFEAIIYSMGCAIFMIVMCKERDELRYRLAAHADSLTGILNRGAFLEHATRTLLRGQKNGASASLIMFDLDRFKWINDSFGHATGDHVIRAFSEVTQTVLRPTDLFGRYGGEEFAVMLPGATIEVAYVIAERVRHNFAQACAFLDERPLNATVSAGVASAVSGGATMDTLMRAADRGLYRAKNLGRNRVERANESTSKVARVA